MAALCLAAATAAAAVAVPPASAAVPVDLETATVAQLGALMTAGTSTSVDITKGYLARIAALSIGGPHLNAVQVVNPDALKDAAAADAKRKAGGAGPLLGIPVLVKDNIDVKGLPTTAGSLALAGNVAPADAPLVTSLRAAGAVLLGKTKLTEFANFLTNGMPAGYSSLGGQVLNAYDVSQTPSGSSAGSGVAASVGLAPLTIGTETSGSILSPANANSDVGIKPTVGLVPRTGIIPIAASQDTAGPIVKTVADAAALLDGITSKDPADGATSGNPLVGHDFLGDLSTTALQGARIGVVVGQAPAATATVPVGTGTGVGLNDAYALYQDALATLRAQGATVVENVPLAPSATSTAPATGTVSTLVYEFKRDLNSYLATRTAPTFPVKTLADVIAFNDAHPKETLKYGQTLALQAQRTDTERDAANAALQRQRDLAGSRARIDGTLQNGTPDDPSDDFTALLYVGSGSAGIGAQAGYPTVLVPAGYTSGQGAAPAGGDATGNRRPFSISFLGKAYAEPTLLGLASDYEAASQLRRAPSELNPSLFRCTALAGSDQTGCTSADVAPATPAGFALRISPATTTVRKGAAVQLSLRLVHTDGTAVSGARVGFYTRGKGASTFALSRSLVTGADGLAFASFKPATDFRWYAVYDVDAKTRGATSAPGLVQVR
ncbi:MAG: Amidase [Frankiales bacterium]|nr:Amidase [Frankiales bacterium]